MEEVSSSNRGHGEGAVEEPRKWDRQAAIWRSRWLTHTMIWVILQGIMLSGKSWSQKAAGCRIPFMQHSGNDKIPEMATRCALPGIGRVGVGAGVLLKSQQQWTSGGAILLYVGCGGGHMRQPRWWNSTELNTPTPARNSAHMHTHKWVQGKRVTSEWDQQIAPMSISIRVAIYYQSLARDHQRGNWVMGTWDLSVISYNSKPIYNDFHQKMQLKRQVGL